MSPLQVAQFPGSNLATIDWQSIADSGETFLFDFEEMDDLGTKPETLRAFAHTWAKEHGTKFRTKLGAEGLFIQVR